MNKSVTDGIEFMPTPFAVDLGVWSSGDGRPGSDTYENASNVRIVRSDPDFGDCLELQKVDSISRVRYMRQTPIMPGCYLRISARIKATSGNLPSARISAFAAQSNGTAVNNVTTVGTNVPLALRDEVVEISAIVGTGNRSGVDMVWGPNAAYGHFGVELLGPNGGTTLIEDIKIEDISSAFVSDLISAVDVRDFGAIGDGVTDDSNAFAAADAAANGRLVLVPDGDYYLGQTVGINNAVRFVGTVTMPDEAMLLIRSNYGLSIYIDAFGDEVTGFKKAFQALLNFSDHESLDLGGRRISLTEPIDMQAAVPNRTTFATRRVIRNGQIEAIGNGWADQVVTSQARYSRTNSTILTNVANISAIQVGSLVTGNGVGREVYVRSKNLATGELVLSAPLYDASSTQDYTFTRFAYLLDFSGFNSLSRLIMSNIEFQCNGRCSGVLLPPSGPVNQFQDCFFTRAKDRGITSHGIGCQGMKVNRCQFLSNEDALSVPDRTVVGLNVNANDVKLKNCRSTRHRHWAVLGGQNHLITGNHFFQGDEVAGGVRSAGIVLAENFAAVMISGNYIDNCYIEWTNERDASPDFNGGFSFASLTIADNVFLAGNIAPWFSYIVVKPHGQGHFLNGLNVAGNRFRIINGSVTRADRVDTSFYDLNHDRHKNVFYEGNSYHNIRDASHNPLIVTHTQNTAAASWTIDTEEQFPFGAKCRFVDSVVASSDIRNGGNGREYRMPVAKGLAGSEQDQFTLEWGTAVRGTIRATVRMDS